MQKTAFYILIMSSFFGCSEDVEPTNEMVVGNEIELFAITLPNYQYFDENYDQLIVLSDSEGEVITDGVMVSQGTTVLRQVFDINETYDLTIINKGFNGQNILYTVKTFADIRPFHLYFENKETLNPENKKIDFCVTDTDNQLEDLSFGFTYSDEIYNSSYSLQQVPEDIYFTYKHKSEDNRRYLWLEDIDDNAKYEFRYDEIEIADEYVTISFPDSEYLAVGIEGINSDSPTKGHYMSAVFGANINPVTEHYLTYDVFDKLFVNSNLRKGGETFHFTEIADTIATNYIIPELKFEIESANSDLIQLKERSPFNYYSVVLSNISADDGFGFEWQIFGKAVQDINYQLPNLEKYLIDDYPNFEFENLQLKSSVSYNIEGLYDYSDFICDKVDVRCESLYKVTKGYEHQVKY